MNDRQRDQFLWLWSRRRQPGRAAIARRGALVGAAGGVLFALVMLGLVIADAGPSRGLGSLVDLLGNAVKLLVLSVPSFAGIGYLGVLRVYNHHELMFEQILASGAKVPEQAPVLRTSDRWPLMVVWAAVALIVGCIIWLFIELW